MRYEDYLKSDHWRDVKSRYRASHKKQVCYVCGKISVDIHHLTYKRIGRERLSDLIALCRACHKEAHDLALFLGGTKTAQYKAYKWLRRRALGKRTTELKRAYFGHFSRKAKAAARNTICEK